MNIAIPNQHTEQYNALPNVEAADEQLNALGKERILSELCELIVNYRLHYVVGVRLLHNHCFIDEQEIMLEADEKDTEKGWCLTTRAVTQSQVTNRYSANSWKLIDGSFYPLEFSTDTLSYFDYDFIRQNETFFEEFTRILESNGVAQLLGPCIIRRQFFASHRPDDAAILVETCDEERRANILRFDDPANYNAAQLIQTTWLAIPPPGEDTETAGCSSNCAPAACVPHTVCVRDGQGGHSSRSHHSSSHTRQHSPW